MPPVEEITDPYEDLVAVVADLRVRLADVEKRLMAMEPPPPWQTHEPDEDPPAPMADKPRFEEDDFKDK